MAMGKNKTGIMAAISAVAESDAASPDARERAQRTLPRGTIGSVRAGLGGIQDVDCALVLPWGPKDRLSVELTAVNEEPASALRELADSIATSGQQVPVLLRPSKRQDGHFEVIYGRRRVMACRLLGVAVKALIRSLDDAEALLAKGLENASRADLSYYERVRFAEAILQEGHSRVDVCAALAISKNTLSQFERIARLVPAEVGDGVGPAPSSGRPKWMALASAFEAKQITGARSMKALMACAADASSDDRLEALLKEAQKRGPRSRGADERQPIKGVSIKSGKSSVTISMSKTGENGGFADWLDHHLDELISESFERFQAENRKGKRS